MLPYAASALSIEKCHLVKTEVITAMHHRCQLPFFIPGCQQHQHREYILMGIPRLVPPANTAHKRRARASSVRAGVVGLKAHLNELRKKASAGQRHQKRPGIGQRRADNGNGRLVQAMSATQEMKPLMAPPPILPTYQRAPHQKPLRRIDERQAGQRRQEPDREVITHVNDADPGFLPPDMHNYVPDRHEIHLPGHSFTDFDGASSRKFLNKKKEEKGGWATVKSLPHLPEMVNLTVNFKILPLYVFFHSRPPVKPSRLTILQPPHTTLHLPRFCELDKFSSRQLSIP